MDNFDDFRGQIPFVTASALTSVLDLVDLVEKEGVPPLHKPKNVKEAVQLKLASTESSGNVISTLQAVKTTNAKMDTHALNLPSLL